MENNLPVIDSPLEVIKMDDRAPHENGPQMKFLNSDIINSKKTKCAGTELLNANELYSKLKRASIE